jgi:hypothetical protein
MFGNERKKYFATRIVLPREQSLFSELPKKSALVLLIKQITLYATFTSLKKGKS